MPSTDALPSSWRRPVRGRRYYNIPVRSPDARPVVVVVLRRRLSSKHPSTRPPPTTAYEHHDTYTSLIRIRTRNIIIIILRSLFAVDRWRWTAVYTRASTLHTHTHCGHPSYRSSHPAILLYSFSLNHVPRTIITSVSVPRRQINRLKPATRVPR